MRPITVSLFHSRIPNLGFEMSKLTSDIQANLDLFVAETKENQLVWGLRNEGAFSAPSPLYPLAWVWQQWRVTPTSPAAAQNSTMTPRLPPTVPVSARPAPPANPSC